MELGDRIKELRDEREMSLTALEDASGVSKAYLSQLERGVASNPSIDSLGKINAGAIKPVGAYFSMMVLVVRLGIGRPV